MRHGDVGDSLVCLGMACATDLSDVQYERIAPGGSGPIALRPKETAVRRPWNGDCDVYSFPQTWGHGSLGFGGMGTASIETVQTTIVMHKYEAAVYFGRRFCYLVKTSKQFIDDCKAHCPEDVEGAVEKYEVIKTFKDTKA